MPIERLALDEFKLLPLDALYLHPEAASDFWLNAETGYAALVTQTTSGTWSYTVLSRKEGQSQYRATTISAGHKSRAEATAKLHLQINDPPPEPYQR